MSASSPGEAHALMSVYSHKAYNRVREGNFLLSGLVGFNLAGKTVGIIGTGKIGMLTVRALPIHRNCLQY